MRFEMPGHPAHELVLRERTDLDLPTLALVMEQQQPATKYPYRWPLDSPVEQFIKRDNEIRAWVAVIEREIVGHVSVTGVHDDGTDLARVWADAHGVDVSELRCVSVLYTNPRFNGRGIGRTLLETATAFAASDGYPVLDVVTTNTRPIRLYERNGWQIVATLPAPWSSDEPLLVHAMVLPATTRARRGGAAGESHRR